MQLARIPIDEVKARLDQNEALVFLDARRPEAWQRSTVQLPGALRVPPSEVEQCLTHIPYNRSIITYCSCPGEASSARVAQALREHGFADIHTLSGGFDAWQQAGYPLEPKPRIAEERFGEAED